MQKVTPIWAFSLVRHVYITNGVVIPRGVPQVVNSVCHDRWSFSATALQASGKYGEFRDLRDLCTPRPCGEAHDVPCVDPSGWCFVSGVFGESTNLSASSLQALWIECALRGCQAM